MIDGPHMAPGGQRQHLFVHALKFLRGEQRRIRGAGGDGIHSDAGAVILDGQVFGEAQHAGLGGGVGARAGARHEGAHGGGGGHPELRLVGIGLDHPGDKDQEAVDGGVEVHAHDPVKVIEGGGLHGAEGVDAGGLDEQSPIPNPQSPIPNPQSPFML